MKLLYFAWVRERIGLAEEEVDLPDTIQTPSDLLVWLKSRGPEFDHAFAEPTLIRVAADQQHIEHDEPLGEAREVALFPPMTGG